MKKVRLFILIVTAIAVIFVGGASIVLRFVAEKTMFNQEKKFVIGDKKEIYIDADDVDIHFNPTDSNSIKVVFSGEVASTNKEMVPELSISEESSKLSIKVNRKKGWALYYKNNLSLTIDIPKTYAEAISVNSSSADVKLKNINVNNFVFKSDSGNINLDNITINDVSVETSSGRVAITNFSGNVNVESNSGDVRIEYKHFNNNVDIKVNSGDTKLVIPENSAFNIVANTNKGKLSNSFPVEAISSTENHLVGYVGYSDKKVIISSESGKRM